ncbi:TVP38/TMEM64 family protein [Candidatus Nitrospira bockiana]
MMRSATCKAAVGAALLAVVAWSYGSALDRMVPSQDLHALVEARGGSAPILFIAVMALAVVIAPIPNLPLAVAAGAAFGPGWGALYTVLGGLLGAVASFSIGRAFGRRLLATRLGPPLRIWLGCSRRHLMLLVFASRLLPVLSFDAVSYGAGLSSLPLGWFAIATLLGMLPPTLALSYLGESAAAGAWTWLLAGLIIIPLAGPLGASLGRLFARGLTAPCHEKVGPGTLR